MDSPVNATHPLDATDYIMFAILLGVSAVTGIYHGLAKGGQQTTSRYGFLRVLF